MTARERLVLSSGAAVLVVALLLSRVVVPSVQRWQTREAQLQAAQARAASLAGLVASTASLEAAAADQERALAVTTRRLIQARSAGLAANALQSLLQGAADGAGMVVSRVDVDAVPDSTGAMTATLMAYGDVHGLASLLQLLHAGPRATNVERLTVQQNSALRGAPDVIQVSIGVRAPVLLSDFGSGDAP